MVNVLNSYFLTSKKTVKLHIIEPIFILCLTYRL